MKSRGRLIRSVGRLAVALAALSVGLASGAEARAADDDVYSLVFPVAGDNTYTDTWGEPRSEGRTHQGVDIFAAKGTPVLAAASGTITRISTGDRAGRYIVLTHDDGWTSYYLHLRNDSADTDDGQWDMPAEGIAVGTKVKAGTVIDYVGDSGNAEETPSHLHFELHQPDGTIINPTPHIKAATTGAFEADTTPGESLIRYDASGIEVLGHVDPGDGFAAGLAVHEDIVYMGTWGRRDYCPNTGVRVIDATDPGSPELLTSIGDAGEYPDTSSDAVWAGAIESDAFSGDLAVVAIRLCDTGERSRRGDTFRGLAFYDVTDPANPALVGTWHSGDLTQGVNDVDGVVTPEGTLLISATVMQSYRHTEGEFGDWRLIDATNPADAVQIAGWDYRAAIADVDPADGDIDLHVHTAALAEDGTSAWLAVWDAGLVMLDLADPAQPGVAIHIPVEADDLGNAHSFAVDAASGLIVRNDEDLEWEETETEPAAWGGQTLYDASDLSRIVPIGTYATENSDLSAGEPEHPGYFSAHEVFLVGDTEYTTWYSDGLRVLDLSDPAEPVEIAWFVPPPKQDPQGLFLGQGRGGAFAMVWGLELADDLIYLSDMHSGLWIVRLETPDEEVDLVPGLERVG